MTAAQIRDAARLACAEAAENADLSTTGEVAEIWVAGFIAGLEAARAASPLHARAGVPLRSLDELLAEARAAAETVGTP